MFELQLAKIWEQALEITRHDVSKPTFDTWFKDTELMAYYGDTLVIKTPNEYCKNTLENSYYHILQKNLEELLEHNIKLTFITPKETGADTLAAELLPKASNAPACPIKEEPVFTEPLFQEQLDFSNFNLNPKYTFDSFVIGKGNNFAYAACEAVANNIISNFSNKRTYNPLFIYGNSGLGKTHLMYAIANVLRRTHPEYRIIYVKGEDFTNELITAIQEGNVQAFRNKYRMVDLLLLDDVQFIAGKERTQEEFFHTFNALYEAKKQIVLTSDRPPKEINTLEDRMKTRFEWGLLADIQPPDFETRIAIIRDKAVKMGVELPDDVSNYIAENIQANIRQLEGAVKKIKAMHELMGERITVSLAENAIDALRTENPGLNPTPERIMEAVANYFYIPVEQMISQNRSKDVAYPRQMAMYMIRQELEYSFPDIAKIFKRDHTTVMHACNKIEEERKNSRETEDVIKKLHNNIRGDG